MHRQNHVSAVPARPYPTNPLDKINLTPTRNEIKVKQTNMIVSTCNNTCTVRWQHRYCIILDKEVETPPHEGWYIQFIVNCCDSERVGFCLEKALIETD